MPEKKLIFARHEIVTHNTSDAIRDLAMKVCLVSGEDDVILEIDSVEERWDWFMGMEHPDLVEFKRIVSEAKKTGATYLHLY